MRNFPLDMVDIVYWSDKVTFGLPNKFKNLSFVHCKFGDDRFTASGHNSHFFTKGWRELLLFYIQLKHFLFTTVHDGIVSQEKVREGGDTLTVTDKTRGYITSHEEFNFGLTFFDIGQDYMLTLRVPTTAVKIKIKYISFNIGTKTIPECENENAKEG